MCVNEGFRFERDAGPQVKRAFSGEVRRTPLPVGARLWKWTDRDDPPAGAVSPWWAPLEPEDIEGCDGMANLREIESQVGIRRRRKIRTPACAGILPEWNSMGKMLVVALRSPVFAFVGHAAMQQMNDLNGQPMPVYLAGGYGQLFIPNLSGPMLEKCEARAELLRLGIADVEFYLKPFIAEIPALGALQPKTRRLLRLLELVTPDERDGI